MILIMVPLVKISLWDYKSIAKQLVFLKATSRSQNRRVYYELDLAYFFTQLAGDRKEILGMAYTCDLRRVTQFYL